MPTPRETILAALHVRLSALPATALRGEVLPERVPAAGLLILREYPGSAVGPGVRGPRNTRVVFSVDLTTFDGLFSAQKFTVNSGDVIVATESPINDVLTISQIFGQIGRAHV